MLSDLEKIGLTKNEGKVYLCLLNNGLVTAGTILKQTRMHRTTLYNILSRLKEKGLVSGITKEQKQHFSAADPERLKVMAEEKNQILKQVIPKLRKIKANKTFESEVQYFTGFEGLKTIYNDILKQKKNYVGYGSRPKIEKALRYYLKHFVREKIRLGIYSKLIYNEKSRFILRSKNSKIRFLREKYSSPVAIRIYADKVVIMVLTTHEPFAVLIKNKHLADDYRERFQYLWKLAKK